jgi:4-hydroxy-L-threonine phosphate dehydrogenase PdxA
MGDPAGAGPEICFKAVRELARVEHPLIIFGDANALSKLRS